MQSAPRCARMPTSFLACYWRSPTHKALISSTAAVAFSICPCEELCAHRDAHARKKQKQKCQWGGNNTADIVRENRKGQRTTRTTGKNREQTRLRPENNSGGRTFKQRSGKHKGNRTKCYKRPREAVSLDISIGRGGGKGGPKKPRKIQYPPGVPGVVFAFCLPLVKYTCMAMTMVVRDPHDSSLMARLIAIMVMGHGAAHEHLRARRAPPTCFAQNAKYGLI